MQNQPKQPLEAIVKFFRDKGYYMVLALCVAAVGVSGYLFVRTASDTEPVGEQPTLSVPLTTEKDDEETEKPQSNQRPVVSTGGTEALTEDSMETAQEQQPEVKTVTVRPLEGDTVGNYSVDALAYNTTTQDWRTHEGIDIAAAAGTEVVAARAGTVSAIYEDNAFGTTVVVDHGDGYESRYASLNAEPAVAVGDVVHAGDVLGTVGTTASVELAQDSHLHFAVYHNGETADPEQFLAGA